MKKYVLASGNPHKIEEINKLLKTFNIKLLSLKDVGLENIEIIEDKETFEGNSFKKAYVVSKKTNLPAIADDSGLMVDYLKGAPGVYSARYAGENATYKDNNKKLLSELENLEFEKRTAKFVTVITIYYPNGDKIVSKGEISGYITKELKGEEGFGYDPLFWVEDYNKTFAEMGSNLKNSISHRARAIENLKKKLEKHFQS